MKFEVVDWEIKISDFGRAFLDPFLSLHDVTLFSSTFLTKSPNLTSLLGPFLLKPLSQLSLFKSVNTLDFCEDLEKLKAGL